MEKNYLESAKDLFQSIIALDSVEECAAFFEDLCTIKEIIEMAKRLSVAELLDSKMSYNEIIAKTDISTATISRISKCYEYGDGGYKTVISRLKEQKK